MKLSRRLKAASRVNNFRLTILALGGRGLPINPINNWRRVTRPKIEQAVQTDPWSPEPSPEVIPIPLPLEYSKPETFVDVNPKSGSNVPVPMKSSGGGGVKLPVTGSHGGGGRVPGTPLRKVDNQPAAKIPKKAAPVSRAPSKEMRKDQVIAKPAKLETKPAAKPVMESRKPGQPGPCTCSDEAPAGGSFLCDVCPMWNHPERVISKGKKGKPSTTVKLPCCPHMRYKPYRGCDYCAWKKGQPKPGNKVGKGKKNDGPPKKPRPNFS